MCQLRHRRHKFSSLSSSQSTRQCHGYLSRISPAWVFYMLLISCIGCPKMHYMWDYYHAQICQFTNLRSSSTPPRPEMSSSLHFCVHLIFSSWDTTDILRTPSFQTTSWWGGNGWWWIKNCQLDSMKMWTLATFESYYILATFFFLKLCTLVWVSATFPFLTEFSEVNLGILDIFIFSQNLCFHYCQSKCKSDVKFVKAKVFSNCTKTKLISVKSSAAISLRGTTNILNGIWPAANFAQNWNDLTFLTFL